MSETKNKKTNIIVTKAFYVLVAVAELGAVLFLAMVDGDTTSTVARIVATPLGVDAIIRVVSIVRPFFKVK